MELHWKKFQVIAIQCDAKIATPDGTNIEEKPSMEYLGTVLHADGSNDHELNRRIGMAKADFLKLSKVWSHSSCTWPKKVRIFSALIESKLLYSLACMCLTVAQVRRLDGFQNRCLRKVLGIKPSFISRVSNADVLTKAQHPSASLILQKRQLQLFGKVLRSPEAHPLHSISFVPGLFWKPRTDQYVRRKGRPNREWVPDVTKFALRITGTWERLRQLSQSKQVWNDTLYSHFNF